MWVGCREMGGGWKGGGTVVGILNGKKRVYNNGSCLVTIDLQGWENATQCII